MHDVFPSKIGLIHARWTGIAWDTAREAEVRFFLSPVAPIDLETGQPRMRWTWACKIAVLPPRCEVTMVQSFTLEGRKGFRRPMPLKMRRQLVLDLQKAAAALGCPSPSWDDWQPTRIRRAALRPQ